MQDYSRTRRYAAATAGFCLLLVLALYLFYVCTVPGRILDSYALDSANNSKGPFLDAANRVLNAVSAVAIVVAIACVLIAIARRRYRVAVASILIVAGANATTQVLKAGVFARPDLGFEDYFPASLPSGHVTMAASISLATLLAVPVAWRWWVGLCGAFITFLVGWSTIVSGWHRPSDMVAAVLVAVAWAAAAVAVGGGWVVAPTEVSGSPVTRRLKSSARPQTATALRMIWLVLVSVGLLGITCGVIVQLAKVNMAIQYDILDSDLIGYVGSVAGYLGVVCGATAVLLFLLEREDLLPVRRNVLEHDPSR